MGGTEDTVVRLGSSGLVLETPANLYLPENTKMHFGTPFALGSWESPPQLGDNLPGARI